MSLTDSHVQQNMAGLDGGGVFKYAGTVAVAASEIHDNRPNDCAPLNSIPGC